MAALSACPELAIVGTSGVSRDEFIRGARSGPQVAIVCVGVSHVPALAFVSAARSHRPRVECLVLFEPPIEPAAVEGLIRSGARGILPESASASDLVRASRAVAAGGVVLAPGITDLVLDWASLAQQQSFAPGLESLDVEILSLLADGLSAPQVSRALSIDLRSIQASLRLSKRVLGASSQHRAVAMALSQGII